jgi:hypothetical protein
VDFEKYRVFDQRPARLAGREYADDKLPDHVDQAGLATILTIIARAAAHEITPPVTPAAIDQFFDPAVGAGWHGAGWQNPLQSKVIFSGDPRGSEPDFASALPLDGKTGIASVARAWTGHSRRRQRQLAACGGAHRGQDHG